MVRLRIDRSRRSHAEFAANPIMKAEGEPAFGTLILEGRTKALGLCLSYKGRCGGRRASRRL
jgi:hypothetical protein